MLNKKRKLFLDKNNQIKMRYRFVAEKIKRTLAYKLKKNKIDYISEKDEEIKIPKDKMIAYLSRKGKIILAPNYAGAHDDIAYLLNPLENKRESTINLVEKGFVMFLDISREDEKMAGICYSRTRVTPEQHAKLKIIKEKYGYEFYRDEIDENDLENKNEDKNVEKEVAVR